MVERLSSEADYDEHVNPLIQEIMDLCKSVNPHIPFLSLCTFARSSNDEPNDDDDDNEEDGDVKEEEEEDDDDVKIQDASGEEDPEEKAAAPPTAASFVSAEAAVAKPKKRKAAATKEIKERSCATAMLPPHASQRMREMVPILQNGGRPLASIFARMMTGGLPEYAAAALDGKWYKGSPAHKKAMAAIDKLLIKIAELVNETYYFPAALIVQTPTSKTYRIVGRHPSPTLEGVQYVRVLAETGYTSASIAALTGASSSLMEQNPFSQSIMAVHRDIKRNRRT